MFPVFFLFLATGIPACMATEFSVHENPNLSLFKLHGVLRDSVGDGHMALTFNLQEEVEAVTITRAHLKTLAKESPSPALWAPLMLETDSLLRTWEMLLPVFKQEDLHRDKRSLLSMGGLLLNTGLSIYDTYELSVLTGRVSGLESSNRHLITALHTTVRTEELMSHDLKVLSTAVTHLRVNLVQVYSDLQLIEAAHRALHRLKMRLRGLEAVAQHRLDTGLLAESDLTVTWANMTSTLQAAGWRALQKSPVEIFNNKVSFATTFPDLIVLVQVPAVPADATTSFTLYEHQQLPVLAPNKTVKLVFSDNANFLAVRLEDNLFFELSSEDLRQCHREKNDYFCSTAFPRMRGSAGSCLSSLFMSREEAAELCQEVELHQGFDIRRLNATTAVVWSSRSIDVNVKCAHEVSQERLDGLATITAPPGCTMSGDDFTFRSLGDALPEVLHHVIAVQSLGVNISVHAKLDFGPSLEDVGNLPEGIFTRTEDEIWKASDALAQSGGSWIMWLIIASVIVLTFSFCLFRVGACSGASVVRRVFPWLGAALSSASACIRTPAPARRRREEPNESDEVFNLSTDDSPLPPFNTPRQLRREDCVRRVLDLEQTPLTGLRSVDPGNVPLFGTSVPANINITVNE